MRNIVHYAFFGVGLCIFLLCSGLSVSAADEDRLAALEVRVKMLEDQLALKQEFLDLSEEFSGLSIELRDNTISTRFELLEQKYAQAMQVLTVDEKMTAVVKELHEDTIGKRFELITQNYEQALKKQEQTIQTLRNEQEAFKNVVKQENLVIYAVWAVLGLLGIGTVIMTPKWIKQGIHQQVGNIFSTEREYIGQLVATQESENRIKETKQLLLVSATNEQDQAIKNQLQLMKFKHIHTRLFKTVFDQEKKMLMLDIQEKQYDLIIFNQLSAEQIASYLERSALDMFVSFSPSLEVRIEKPELRAKVNFTNSLFTLYARTMDVLRYQELLGR